MRIAKRINEDLVARAEFQEALVYLIIWLLVFLLPIANEAICTVRGQDFSWKDIGLWWGRAVPFLIVFLIHNYILIPKLFQNQKVRTYAAAAILLILSFGIYQYSEFKHKEKELMGRHATEHPHMPPPHGMKRIPHKLIPLPVVMSSFIAIIMCSFNLVLVLLFKYQREQEKTKALETSRLQHELKYLKAQINPHFFMNILNNIHGMVEIDPLKAQEMILELSNLMRYVLYEGKNKVVTLDNEVRFIKSYAALMRRRFPESKVIISLDLPDNPSETLTLPPLLFLSFMENAFKHGISYKKVSVVEIGLHVENGKIYFSCRNTKPDVSEEESDNDGGVGLTNVRRRLELLYGEHYILNIENDADKFSVELIIPDLI